MEQNVFSKSLLIRSHTRNDIIYHFPAWFIPQGIKTCALNNGKSFPTKNSWIKMAQCQTRISSYKIPDSVQYWSSFNLFPQKPFILTDIPNSNLWIAYFMSIWNVCLKSGPLNIQLIIISISFWPIRYGRT